MSRTMRLWLIVMVMLNIGFVYITSATSFARLLPLVALTLGSPWLARLNRFLLYRLLWNLAVLTVFALLVQHVTTHGPHLLLEDGLLLAILCQVHLLNNLRREQRTDLLFFNAFLIATVTSFICQDVAYCLMLIAFAPVSVMALQHRTLNEHAAPAISEWLPGVLRSAQIVVVTLLIFLFLPRNFNRPGLLGDRVLFSAGMFQIGFQDEIQLQSHGDVKVSDDVVLQARLLRGSPADVPTYWRGATLDVFDGSRWIPAPFSLGVQPWRTFGSAEWVRGRGPTRAVLDIRLQQGQSGRLFLPLEAVRLQLESTSTWNNVRPRSDLVFEHDVTPGNRHAGRYEVQIGNPLGRVERGASRSIYDLLLIHLQVLPDALPPQLLTLREEILQQLPPDAAPLEVARACRDRLAAEYRYVAPGGMGAASSLAGFLRSRGGHCEYFATTLALLLRLDAIPCRVVTGFRSAEWDAEQSVLTVRSRHAHAWVEVLDLESGWMTLDATPPAEETGPMEAATLWDRWSRMAETLWYEITGFNEGSRERFLGEMARMPGRVAAGVRERPVTSALMLACVAALGWCAHIRRRRRLPAAVLKYLRGVRSAGMRRRPPETPRQTLLRAAAELKESRELALLEATREHERARYSSARSEPALAPSTRRG